jgi:hypothetical protein
MGLFSAAMALVCLSEAPVAFTANQLVWTEASALNLRATPDAKAKVLLKVPYGSHCEHVETQGDWAHVRCFGREGWVKTQFLEGHVPDDTALRSKRDTLPLGPEKVEVAARLASHLDARLTATRIANDDDARAFARIYERVAFTRHAESFDGGTPKALGTYVGHGECQSDAMACTRGALALVHPDAYASAESTQGTQVMLVSLLRNGQVAVDVGTISGPRTNVVTVEQTERFVPSLTFLEAFKLVPHEPDARPTQACLAARTSREKLSLPAWKDCLGVERYRDVEWKKTIEWATVCIETCDSVCLECSGACTRDCASACTASQSACVATCTAEATQRFAAAAKSAELADCRDAEKTCNCRGLRTCRRQCLDQATEDGVDDRTSAVVCASKCTTVQSWCPATCQ